MSFKVDDVYNTIHDDSPDVPDSPKQIKKSDDKTPITDSKTIANLYDKLDLAETEEINIHKEMGQQLQKIQKLEDEIKKNDIVYSSLAEKIIRIKKEIEHIHLSIFNEREKISNAHQKIIQQLKESNNEIAISISKQIPEQKLQQEQREQIRREQHEKYEQQIHGCKDNGDISLLTSYKQIEPTNIKGYRKRLIEHMSEYKSDPWHDWIVYTLSHIPMENNQETIDYVNKIPIMPISRTCSVKLSEWLSGRQVDLQKSVKNKHKFFDFMLSLKNAIHIFNREPAMSKEKVYAKYKLST